MKGIVVCKDCTDRVLGCHSTCIKYIEDKERYEKEKEKIREAKRKEKAIDDYENKRSEHFRKKYKYTLKGSIYGRQGSP